MRCENESQLSLVSNDEKERFNKSVWLKEKRGSLEKAKIKQKRGSLEEAEIKHIYLRRRRDIMIAIAFTY